MRGAEYFMTPQADLRSSCVRAKILRHINDALTAAITVRDTEGNDCSEWKQQGLFSFGGWRWILPMIGWFIEAADSLSVWDETWCYLYPSIPPLPISHLPLFIGALQCMWQFSAGLQPTGDPSPSEQPAPSLHTKAARNDLGRKKKRGAAFHPSRLVANEYKYPHVQHPPQTCAHTGSSKIPARHPASFVFPRLPWKKAPAARETNCCMALALQWRMKVHGARQTSIPLQPPLSNKHIYYSGWARLEVSPHTHLQRAAIQGNEIQDALCWEFQTRTSEKRKKKKKKGNKWPSLALLPAEELRATASVYILEERVSWSDDVLWFFFFSAALPRLGAAPFFHHHFLLRTWAWHHFHRDGLLESSAPLYHSD